MSLKEIVLDLIQASVPDMYQTCALHADARLHVQHASILRDIRHAQRIDNP